MKTLFSYILLLFISLATLVSCISKKPADPVILTKTQTIKEVVRDTVFQAKADSSFYQALIECQNGKPVLRQTMESTPGKHLKTPNVTLSKEGVLEVKSESPPQDFKYQWTEKSTAETVPTIVPCPEPKEKPYPWYVTGQLWAGRLLLLILLLIVIEFLYKRYK